jgi:hypothetical protein
VSGIVIEEIGGMCPVQAEGTIDGKLFYFRARGDSWSIGIGREPLFDPEWEYAEDYGVWPEAGYMEADEAKAFIEKAVALYRADKGGAP